MPHDESSFGVLDTLHRFSPIRAFYRCAAEDFAVTEIDTLGVVLPTTPAAASGYRHSVAPRIRVQPKGQQPQPAARSRPTNEDIISALGGHAVVETLRRTFFEKCVVEYDSTSERSTAQKMHISCPVGFLSVAPSSSNDESAVGADEDADAGEEESSAIVTSTSNTTTAPVMALQPWLSSALRRIVSPLVEVTLGAPSAGGGIAEPSLELGLNATVAVILAAATEGIASAQERRSAACHVDAVWKELHARMGVSPEYWLLHRAPTVTTQTASTISPTNSTAPEGAAATTVAPAAPSTHTASLGAAADDALSFFLAAPRTTAPRATATTTVTRTAAPTARGRRGGPTTSMASLQALEGLLSSRSDAPIPPQSSVALPHVDMSNAQALVSAPTHDAPYPPVRLTPTAPTVLRLSAAASKLSRARVHTALGAAFGPSLDRRGEGHSLLLTPRGSRRRDRGADEARDIAETDDVSARGGFCAVLLKKRSVGSFELRQLLAAALNLTAQEAASVAFAGAKDKIAITVQRATIPVAPLLRLLNSVTNDGASAAAPTGVAAFLTHALSSSESVETNSRGGEFNILNDSSGRRFVSLFSPQRVERPLSLGDANGNMFTVVLQVPRHPGDGLSSDPAALLMELQRRAALICTTGFVNFFGPQRFGADMVSARDAVHNSGATAPPADLTYLTHVPPGTRCALHSLRGEYDLALRALFAVDPASDVTTTAADNCDPVAQYRRRVNDAKRHFLHAVEASGGVVTYAALEAALREVPPGLQDLRRLLPLLRANACDARAALRAMPFEFRQMQIHAAQSLIWNIAASARVSRGGALRVDDDLLRVRTGDWVRQLSASASTAGPGVAAKNSPYQPPQWVGPVVVVAAENTAAAFAAENLVLPLIGVQACAVSSGGAGSGGAAAASSSSTEALVLDAMRRCGLASPESSLQAAVASCSSVASSALGWSSLPGSHRPLIVAPYFLRVDAAPATGAGCESGTRDSSRVVVQCGLPPGSYVSVLLRELLGAQPLVPMEESAATSD